MERLLTREEAASLLRKPPSWLRYAERHRLLPYIKVGQQVRYTESDIRAYLHARTVPSREQPRRRAGGR